jgi:hypothetical protein
MTSTSKTSKVNNDRSSFNSCLLFHSHSLHHHWTSIFETCFSRLLLSFVLHFNQTKSEQRTTTSLSHFVVFTSTIMGNKQSVSINFGKEWIRNTTDLLPYCHCEWWANSVFDSLEFSIDDDIEDVSSMTHSLDLLNCFYASHDSLFFAKMLDSFEQMTQYFVSRNNFYFPYFDFDYMTME